MTDDLVSIITPAYKAERTLPDTVRSVQDQTHRHWEMLIVDDGSPDGTGDIVEEFCRQDSRIHLIRQANAGPAMARQAALEQARGRYIAFLDSDDVWLPEKLSRQIAFMKQQGAAVSYTAFRRIRADGGGEGRRIPIPASLSYRQLLGDTAMATSTVVVDRSLTGDFRMTKTYYDDFVLWLDLLKRGHVARGLDEDLMRYRVMSGSVSRNKGRSAAMVWRTYRDIERLSLLASAYHFMRYAFHAWRKYRTF